MSEPSAIEFEINDGKISGNVVTFEGTKCGVLESARFSEMINNCYKGSSQVSLLYLRYIKSRKIDRNYHDHPERRFYQSFIYGKERGPHFDTTDEEIAKANGIYNEKGKYGGDVIIVEPGTRLQGLMRIS